MQFMGKDKNSNSMVAIYCIFSLYVLFLLFDYAEWNLGERKEHLNQHIKNISSMDELDGLILGGSNSAFSLSAENLSGYTSLNWYNVSLPNEGYSDINYHNFIEEHFSENIREEVEIIIYSTLKFSRKNHIINRENYEGNILGYSYHPLKPNQSLLSYFQKFLLRGKFWGGFSYSPPTKFGDFDFSKLNCMSNNIETDFYMENIQEASNQLLDDINYFHSLFPKAKIVIEFPIELFENDIESEKVKKYFQKISDKTLSKYLNINTKKAQNISFLDINSYPNTSFLCDAPHHANEYGRDWRTANLISKFEQLQIF